MRFDMIYAIRLLSLGFTMILKVGVLDSLYATTTTNENSLTCCSQQSHVLLELMMIRETERNVRVRSFARLIDHTAQLFVRFTFMVLSK